MVSRIRLSLAVLGVLAILSVPAVAVAATPGTAATSAPAPISAPATGAAPPSTAPLIPVPLQAQLILGAQPGQVGLVVGFQVPSSQKLPVAVHVPLPAGTAITWAGELMGGTGANDIELPYRIFSGTGGQAVELTLTKSHRGQVEMDLQPLVKNGAVMSTMLPWVQSVRSTGELFSIRFPPGATHASMTPSSTGQFQVGQTGETLYGLPPVTLALGQRYPVTASYQASGTAGAVAGTVSGSSETAFLWIIGVLAVIGIALVAAVAFQRRAASR